MLNFEYETYSEDLVFAARVLTQLQVNLYHHYHNWDELRDACHADYKHNVCMIDDQIMQLKELRELARMRFQTLLLQESDFDFQLSPNYPYIEGYPDWIPALFRGH